MPLSYDQQACKNEVCSLHVCQQVTRSKCTHAFEGSISPSNQQLGFAVQFAGGKHIPELQKALKPMQIILQEQPFLGGTEPNFADLAVAGNFAV